MDAVPAEAAMKSAVSTPCAACKLLRRRCTKECVFAPYFPPEEPQKFACVHRVFGASNVNKMLQVLTDSLSFYSLFSLGFHILVSDFMMVQDPSFSDL
jgi:hypothetical protein